jgi:hypothetical protein
VRKIVVYELLSLDGVAEDPDTIGCHPMSALPECRELTYPGMGTTNPHPQNAFGVRPQTS